MHSVNGLSLQSRSVSTPTLTSSDFLVDKPQWRIRSTIIEATISSTSSTQSSQRASSPIVAPDSEDSVLPAAHLRAIEGEKEDFDTFSSDDDAKISTNKTFLEHNLDSDKTDGTDSDNEDWEDFFPDNAQQRRSSNSSGSHDTNDENHVTSKPQSTTTSCITNAILPMRWKS